MFMSKKKFLRIMMLNTTNNRTAVMNKLAYLILTFVVSIGNVPKKSGEKTSVKKMITPRKQTTTNT